MPSALLAEALAPLRADPAHAVILLDIDGTLAPIVKLASDARVPEPTRKLVTEIAKRYGTVACVSGRHAPDARALVAVGTISYLGSHGAELLRAGWTEHNIDLNLDGWAERVQEFGRELDTPNLRRQGVRLENKGPIVAFHWRGAPDEDAARTAIDAIADRAESGGLHTHWGRKVLEVRPPVRIDKGSGIAAFLEGADVDTALYVGDDLTDLDAFRMLSQMVEHGRLSHAVRVAVRSDESPSEVLGEADFTVEGTSGVQELLQMLIAR